MNHKIALPITQHISTTLYIDDIRPNKLNIRFLVPHPRSLTAGCVPCAHAQLNYVTVAFWMYISFVATQDYIMDDHRKLNYVTVAFWKYRPWLCETTLQTELRNSRLLTKKILKKSCAPCVMFLIFLDQKPVIKFLWPK